MSQETYQPLTNAQKIQILVKCHQDRAVTAEFERIQTAAKRYETLRRLNPRQFADLYAKNLQTGTPFDELVDELARGDQA